MSEQGKFFDYNDAPAQRSFELIPDGTIAPLLMVIQPGNETEFSDGYGKLSDSGVIGLNVEVTIVDGPHKGRKLFDYMMIKGEDTDGHNKAIEITRSRIRSLLESARGIMPGDESETARKSRQISGWGALDGIAFVGVIGIEKGKPTNPNDPKGDRYPDRNRIKGVITPERDEWQDVSSFANVSDKPKGRSGGAKALPKAAGGKPSWAS